MKNENKSKNAIQIYLKQIENIKVMSRAEEEICAKKAAMGDQMEHCR